MPSQFHDVLNELNADLAEVRLAPAAAIRAIGRRRQRQKTGGLVIAGVATVGLVAVPVTRLIEGPQTAEPAHGGCSSSVPPTLPGVTTIIFFSKNSTKAQQHAVEAKVGALGVTTTTEFESRDEALARFKIMACAEPGLVAVTRPEDIPESLLVVTRKTTDYATVKQAVVHMPGVEEVFATR
jgi:FtsX-like permease family protein